MRILIAPDKFKGSLTAEQVAQSIATGLRGVLPDAVIDTMALADGGEGTASAISQALGGEKVNCLAHDALGREIETEYFWLADRAMAVMEMSAAAGLWRIAQKENDLLRADTFGVGEMVKDAVRREAREILIGLGGSATNDGGFGMARALGFQFRTDEHEIETPAGLVNLTRITRSDAARDLTALSRQDRDAFARTFPKLTGAVDVQNPLLGQRGATRVFGPQKGGTPEALDVLERGLTRLAEVVRRNLGCDFQDVPGAGAAGGLGFGLMSFCGATVSPGFDLVADLIGLQAAIERADVVITGEGCLDRQTLEGKAPAGVAHLSRRLGKRVFAIAGCAAGEEALNELFDGIFLLATAPITREEAIMRAKELLEARGRQLAQAL